MARAPQSTATEMPRDHDALDGIPLPREQMAFFGHAHAEAELLAAYKSGRMHHGWILGGPEGIGKATLAFRFARFMLANPDPRAARVQMARDLSVDAGHMAVRRVNAGAHVDLVHLSRPWDDKAKRFKTELTVEEVRRGIGFFGTTAGDGGWRVAIVDTADDMNTNAANALLKVLEEPPQRSIFLVLSHQPGRLLPTIRSRCRKLLLSPLGDAEMLAGLKNLDIEPDADAAKQARLIALAEGSLRRAIAVASGEALAIADEIAGLAEPLPRLDILRLHRLADKLTARTAEGDFRIAVDLILAIPETRARLAALSGDLRRAARLADTRATIEQGFAQSDIYNLDKRAALLSAFRALVEATAN